MTDEALYTAALSNYDSDLRDNDLYNKAYVLERGDVEATKFTYISLWVEKKKSELKNVNAINIGALKKNNAQDVDVLAVQEILKKSHNYSYENVVKGKSVFDELKKSYGEKYIDLVLKALHGDDKNLKENFIGVHRDRLSQIKTRFNNHLNLNGQTMVHKAPKALKAVDYVNEKVKVKTSLAPEEILLTTTSPKQQSKASRIQYISAWLITGFLATVMSKMMPEIFSESIDNEPGLIFVFMSVAWIFSSILVYSVFNQLEIKKVVPWMWLFCAMGSIIDIIIFTSMPSEIRQPFNVDTFILLTLTTNALNVIVFQVYFHLMRPVEYERKS